MVGEGYVSGDVFIWSCDRAHLTVAHEGDSWSVTYRTQSPLLGPNQVIYEARHRLPTHAAWDVLARVSRVTHDEEEGVRVAKQAARWMCEMMWPPNGPPSQHC